MSFIPKKSVSVDGIVFGGETQQAINKRMQDIIKDFASVFTDTTGRFTGKPIKSGKSNEVPLTTPKKDSFALQRTYLSRTRKNDFQGYPKRSNRYRRAWNIS